MAVPSALFTKYSVFELSDDCSAATPVWEAWQCSAQSIGITSADPAEQTLSTLCPDGSWSDSESRTYSLDLTIVQDVESKDAAGDPNALMFYSMLHDGETKCFRYYPKSDAQGKPVGFGFQGMVKVAPVGTIGGTEAGNFATATLSWGLQGKFSVVDATGAVVAAFDANNISKEADFTAVAAMADLATLKADATLGDGTCEYCFRTVRSPRPVRAPKARWP